MRRVKTGIFCLIILLGVQYNFAQVTNPRPIYDPNNPPPDWVRRMDDNRRALDKLNGKDDRGMIAGRRFEFRPKPIYTKEETEKIMVLSAPKPEDLTAYKDFLVQPRTGMFRIFPDLGCKSKFLLQVDGDCENNYFGRHFYSFRPKALMTEDIRFLNGELITDNFFSQGILVRLGDTDVSKLDLTSDGIKFLDDFAAPTTVADAKKEYPKFVTGIEAGGYRYANKAKLELNTTYGLRVIAYRVDNNFLIRYEGNLKRNIYTAEDRMFMAVKLDNRMDVIVAFRIIRKDEDGSITAIWKELKHQEAPKLIFKKDEKYADIK